MKKVLAATLLIVCTLVSAQDHYRLSETGMKFKFLNDEKGHTANIGEFASLDMVMTSENGQVLRSSYKEGKPVLFPVKISHFEGDIYEAVSLMSENDSAEFLINADSMYAKVFRKPKPSFIQAGENLKFVIKVHEIYTQKEYRAKQEELYNSKYKESAETLKARRKKDEARILDYFANEGIDNYKKTSSGVYYSLVEEGKGNKLEKGNAVVFHFTGKLIDGTVFENTFETNQPYSFTLGEGNVIQGWEDAFKLLKVGSTATVAIPSDLAYGALAKGEKIPPHSILVFDVKILASY